MDEVVTWGSLLWYAVPVAICFGWVGYKLAMLQNRLDKLEGE